jgi:hypothetical protein
VRGVAVEPVGLDVDVAADRHVVRQRAEPEDLGEEPDVHVERVRARPEEDGESLLAVLVLLLLQEHVAEARLHGLGRHLGREHEDVGTEVRIRDRRRRRIGLTRVIDGTAATGRAVARRDDEREQRRARKPLHVATLRHARWTILLEVTR